MVGGTIGGELDLGCMNGKRGRQGDVGSAPSASTPPAASRWRGGQNDLPMPGARLEGKIGIKACKKFGFI